MRRLTVFNNVSVDGYFVDRRGDMQWAHENSNDPQWAEFVRGNASGGGVLVFGRVTYQMMESAWTSPMMMRTNPVVAERMTGLPKIVFSRTLKDAAWRNTTLVKGDLTDAMRRLKSEPGDDMVILGSGSIVAQLTQARLIDAYRIVVTPLVLGAGRTLFEGIERRNLKLQSAQPFHNGNVVLTYTPA